MEKTALQTDFGTFYRKLSLSSAHRVQRVQVRLQEGACLRSSHDRSEGQSHKFGSGGPG